VQSEHTVQQGNRGGFASTGTLVLAGIPLASGAAKLVLDGMRRSDECRTAITFTLDLLIWTALVSSAWLWSMASSLWHGGPAASHGRWAEWPLLSSWACSSSSPASARMCAAVRPRSRHHGSTHRLLVG
jgi:hypothetical protein